MADSKITALTSIGASTDPVNDPLVLVDVSDTSMAATGTTKKVTLNQLLGASGTATLASATITGDLTVDTSTLKVDSANNRVGIGTATPGNTLHVIGGNAGQLLLDNGNQQYTQLLFQRNSALNTGGDILIDGTGSTFNFRTLAANMPFVWHLSASAGSPTTAMTLNSTGLGVGVTPSYKLDINGAIAATVASGAAFRAIRSSSGDRCLMYPLAAGSGINIQSQNAAESDFTPIIFGGSTITFNYRTGVGTLATGMLLDASGNLLVGTTSQIRGGQLSVDSSAGVASGLKTSAGSSVYVQELWNTGSLDNSFINFGTDSTFTARGSITYNRSGGLVAYNTTSDYRAKDIIGPVSNSGSVIDSLKVYIGKMKGASVERPMLVAHEAQSVAPYSVTGQKDEVDADGNPKYQQMDVSSFVPLLIAEIQSLRTRVAALEA